MTGRLKLLVNEVKRRVLSGETIDDILESYKLLTPEEKQTIIDNI